MQSFWDSFLTQYTCQSISFLVNQHFGHGGQLGHCGHFSCVKNGDYLGNDDLLDFDQSKLDFVKN